MKRIFLILFAFATICSARQITTSNYTNTPYRERMKSSVSSAILIGVPGTGTAADTCVGTYIYSFQMHQFPVEKSGFYLLYEDVLGGTSYTRRTDWSTISGKYVVGKDPYYKIRLVSQYAGIMDAINDRTTSPQPGMLLASAYDTSYVADTTIVLTSGIDFLFPSAYRVDWIDRSIKTLSQDVLFNVWSDSNITIKGGTYYGNSDNNYLTGNVSSYVNTTNIIVDGLSVAADSLAGWFIHISAGTGFGQCRRVSTNTATSAGLTTITTTTAWTTPPNATSDYRVSTMDQHNSAFSLMNSKHILIDGVQIYNFSGDGITVEDCDDIKIVNSTIHNPFMYAYAAGYTLGVPDANGIGNYVGRQGISIISRDTDYPEPTYPHPANTSAAGIARNIIIDNCKIIGGNPAGIDIEPNGSAAIDNVLISNCIITGGYRGIQIGNTSASFSNIKVSNTIITGITNYVTDLTTGVNAKNIEYNNVTFKNSNGMYFANSHSVRFVNCKFDSLSNVVNNPVPAAYIVGTCANVEFINCEFVNNYKGAIYASGNISHMTIDGCVFRNNSLETAGMHSTIYLNGCNNIIIKGNYFYDTISPTQSYPIYLTDCDSIYIDSNKSFNMFNNTLYIGTGNTNIFQSNNMFGPLTGIKFSDYSTVGYGKSVSLLDTVGIGDSAITSLRIGDYRRGDSTVGQNHEASRNQITFSGYRNTEDVAIGAKIVGQNYAAYGTMSAPGADCDTCSTSQNTNILIYTLNGKHMEKPDDTDRALTINKYGIMLRDTGYITFAPNESDSSWKFIGTSGYGIHSASGVLKAKNSGGTWTKLLAFIGVKNKNYQAAVGDLWFSSKRDTLWYKASADTSFYLLVDGNSVGKH